jgi:hypothetical protein
MHEPCATIRFPQDESKWRRGADGWERGRMPVAANHELRRQAKTACYVLPDVRLPSKAVPDAATVRRATTPFPFC